MGYLIEIPVHVRDTIMNLAGQQTTVEGLDPLVTAINTVRSNLQTSGVRLYQHLLVALQNRAVEVRVRVMFKDERINQVLDTTEVINGRACIPSRLSGWSWIRHAGNDPMTYRITIRALPIHYLVGGQPYTLPPNRILIIDNHRVEPNIIDDEQFSATLMLHDTIRIVDVFTSRLQAAYERGVTHRII